jgi:hypothetical protein
MHPYFSTPVQSWQTFNPFDIGMPQRPFPWFGPAAYHAMYNQAMHRGAFAGFETSPYYASIFPRPVFHASPPSVSPEMAHGMSPVGYPGFGVSEYLSPENFTSGFGKTAGNYLSPEFLEFLRAELIRCGKALRNSRSCTGA